MRRRWLVAVATVGIFALLGSACGGSDSGDEGAGGGGDAEAPAAVADGAAYERSGDGGGDSGGGGVANRGYSAIPSSDSQVIKTARLRVEVRRDSFSESLQAITAGAERAGGFVLSTTTEGEGARSGETVIRVPADAFESVLGEIKSLGKVTSETVSGEDVSEEFVDLQARTRNLEAQETVLLRLMGRAKSVVGTIKVQRELQDVQLEIETLRGRLRFLEDQTSFSTISVALAEAGSVPETAGLFARAWGIARDTTAAVVTAVVIGLGAALPIVLLLLVLLLLVRSLRPLVARFLG